MTEDEKLITADERQNPLIPTKRPKISFRLVPLDELPSDEEIGPPRPEAALVRSIRDFGVWQSVALVDLCPWLAYDEENDCERTPNRYEIVGGRRRIQAARQAGLVRIPAMVGDGRDGTALDALAALDVSLNATATKNELAYLERIE